MFNFYHLVKYEMIILLRNAFSWVTPLLFYIIVVCLFPLGISPDPLLLQTIAPGIIWIAMLLALLISLGNLFLNDIEERHIDILLLSPHSPTLIVLSKIGSHWLTHALPLIAISPFLGFLLHLNGHEIAVLSATLILGTPVLSLIGAIGAALTVMTRSHSLLLPLLIMPFYIPVLIFGTGAVMAAHINQPCSPYFAIIGALLLLTLAFAPRLTAMALRIGAN